MNTFAIDGIDETFPWYKRMPRELWRKLRKYVYERDGGKCRYCGKPVELKKCHIHHALEISKFGTNHPSNLKTLCVECHKKRHPFMLSALERISSDEIRESMEER